MNSQDDAEHVGAVPARFSLNRVTTPQSAPSAVVIAVQQGDIARLAALLAAGAGPDHRDERTGLTALMLAAARGDAAAVRVLLAAGADPHATEPRSGSSVMHKASQGGDAGVARLLLAAGAFVDPVSPSTGHTPLLEALWFGHPAVVAVLLDAGADVEVRTRYGVTLREHFSYELAVSPVGRDRLLRSNELLAGRTERDAVAVVEQVLMAATTAGDFVAVRHALRAGVAVDEAAPRRGGYNDAQTPLQVAARDGRAGIARLLLESGADVNQADPVFGSTPLHKAVLNGHADVVRVLLTHPGVELDPPAVTDGYSPLHAAVRRGHEACARLLLSAGAGVDVTGHDGKTPLDFAVEVLGEGHELTALIRRLHDQPAA